MSITFRTQNAATIRRLQVIQAAFRAKAHKPHIRRVAEECLARLVAATPKKWTGNTRQEWKMIETEDGFVLENNSKVMLFLEKGTQAHGPVKAKALFIPLTRAAAFSGWTPELIRGKDYILRTRVKGIKAQHIVKEEKEKLPPILRAAMETFIREVISAI